MKGGLEVHNQRLSQAFDHDSLFEQIGLQIDQTTT